MATNADERNAITKADLAWQKIPIPLEWLASFDEPPEENSLRDAFGDSYLYRHNPVYRNIRDAALGCGYRFCAADTPLWRQYQAFPLMSLERILADKIIPYLDTGNAFREIMKAKPGGALTPGFIASTLRKNHVFHESAHGVAHHLLSGCDCVSVVFRALLAESFANTVEILGALARHQDLLDSVFYTLNSYAQLDFDRKDSIQKGMAEVGPELGFRVVYFSYIESNLTAETPPDSVYEEIVEATNCPPASRAAAIRLAKVGLGLNQAFRSGTTPAYFEFFGHRREYEALVETGWWRRPELVATAHTAACLLGGAALKTTPVATN